MKININNLFCKPGDLLVPKQNDIENSYTLLVLEVRESKLPSREIIVKYKYLHASSKKIRGLYRRT